MQKLITSLGEEEFTEEQINKMVRLYKFLDFDKCEIGTFVPDYIIYKLKEVKKGYVMGVGEGLTDEVSPKMQELHTRYNSLYYPLDEICEMVADFEKKQSTRLHNCENCSHNEVCKILEVALNVRNEFPQHKVSKNFEYNMKDMLAKNCLDMYYE